MSFHENRHSDKNVFEQESVFKIGTVTVFEQTLFFMKIGTVTKKVFDLACVFMKIGTVTKKFST